MKNSAAQEMIQMDSLVRQRQKDYWIYSSYRFAVVEAGQQVSQWSVYNRASNREPLRRTIDQETCLNIDRWKKFNEWKDINFGLFAEHESEHSKPRWTLQNQLGRQQRRVDVSIFVKRFPARGSSVATTSKTTNTRRSCWRRCTYTCSYFSTYRLTAAMGMKSILSVRVRSTMRVICICPQSSSSSRFFHFQWAISFDDRNLHDIPIECK